MRMIIIIIEIITMMIMRYNGQSLNCVTLPSMCNTVLPLITSSSDCTVNACTSSSIICSAFELLTQQILSCNIPCPIKATFKVNALGKQECVCSYSCCCQVS